MLAFLAVFLLSFSARAQYDDVTQPIMPITAPGVQPDYVAGSNIGQYPGYNLIENSATNEIELFAGSGGEFPYPEFGAPLGTAVAQFPNWGQNYINSTGTGVEMIWLGGGTGLDLTKSETDGATALTANIWNHPPHTGTPAAADANIANITFDNIANSTLTPGSYSCGGFLAGKGHVQPLSAPDHWWPDSLDLYYEAMKYENSGSPDSELQKGLDTMRLYVQEHPYADNNLTIEAIMQTGIFVGYMGREDSSLNDKLQYNWLIHAMLWNLDTAYQDAIWSSLASDVTWDPNLEANVWYNNIIRFHHPVMDWEAIETIRKSQRGEHPPADTTPFYIMKFPPDTIPINGAAGVTSNARSAASASLVLNPNPASTKLTVDFTLVQGGQAQILIYDETGNMIRAITNGPHPAGLNEIIVPLSDLSNGHYFVRLASGGEVVTKELIVQH